MPDVIISYKDSQIASMDASGTKTLLTEGKYCEDDIVVQYTKPSAPTPTLQSKTVSPSTSQQTVSPDSGYDGLSQVTVNAISPTKAAQTYTPTTTNQTIQSGRWLTGAQTIKGDANLVASNIKKDVQIFGVTGSYEGGGGVETKSVTSNYAWGNWCYVDANGVAQTFAPLGPGDGLNAVCPVGSLISVVSKNNRVPSVTNATLVWSITSTRDTYKWMGTFQVDS